VGEEAFSMNSDSLIDMGYKVFYKKPCLVELRSDIGSNYVYCEPKRLEEMLSNGKQEVTASLF
jgi:zona occludens toxin